MTQTLPQMYGYQGQQQGPPGQQQGPGQGPPQTTQHSSYQSVPSQPHGPPQYRVSPDGQAVSSPYGPPPPQSSAAGDPRYTPPQYRGPDGQPMNSSYGPPPPGPGAPGAHPNGINPNRPEMAPVHPQYHQPYHQPQEVPRLPGPTQFYAPAPHDYRPPQDYRQAPPAGQPQPSGPTHAAPRQRTAIACKYCRRRKIRCSGFENSEDGRCQNCQRFNQECVFTPVSAQAQAFVPASALYAQQRGRGVPTQYYGPQGQPLPRQPEGYGYNLPSPGYPPPPPGQPGYGPPGYPQQQQPQQHYDQSGAAGAGRRRARDEPHTPTLPPPNPGSSSHLAGHPGPENSQYTYPDPNYSNGSGTPGSAAPYQTHPPQGYYSNQPYSHNPPTGYQYDQPRDTSSPHGQQSYGYGQSGLAPQASQTPGQAGGRTPPPLSSTSENGGNRNSVAIRDIVSESNGANGQGERTAADSDMVSALNRTSRR